MRMHPLAKPTVFISSMPALRLRRAATRLVGPKRRLRRMVATAGVLIAVAGGIRVLHSHRSDAVDADQGSVFKASSAGCQTPSRST